MMQCDFYCPGETFALLRFSPGGAMAPPSRTSMKFLLYHVVLSLCGGGGGGVGNGGIPSNYLV